MNALAFAFGFAPGLRRMVIHIMSYQLIHGVDRYKTREGRNECVHLINAILVFQ